MRTLLALLLVVCGNLWASEAVRLDQAGFAASHPPGSQQLVLRNRALLTWLWADVYAAALYTEPNIAPQAALREQRARRLELYYFQKIAREDVIRAAWTVLERQHDPATLARLRPGIERLHASFRDIRPGDRYALQYDPLQGLTLERNGETLLRSDDAELARAYMGIWLARDGLSEPLRQRLLAER